MNAKQLTSIINIGLVIAFIGLLLSFPFKEQLLGGILFAICSASLIGGLADSFAVKAIFGQPLKVKWPTWLGTNIIARHRARLVDELVKMVQDELLAPESIRLALKDKKLSMILQNFLQSETGEQTVKQLLHGAIKETVKTKHIMVLLVALKRLVSQLSSKSESSKHVATLINYIFNERIDDTMASFLVKMIKPMLNNDELKLFVTKLINVAISKYEKDNRRRQLANQMANIDANQLTTKLFDYVNEWLFEFISSDHPARQKIKLWGEHFVQQVEQDDDYAQAVNHKINAFVGSLVQHATKGKGFESFLNEIEQAIHTEDIDHVAYRWSQLVVDKVQHLISTTSLANYDEAMLEWLLKLVESKHDLIGKLVNEKLDEYSTEELIALVEEKAGRDLQFIRLNGAVVGGLIGALLFIAQYVLGGAV